MRFFKKKVDSSKNLVGSRQNDPPATEHPKEAIEFTITTGMLHCCCSLDPRAFKMMMGASRLDPWIWYKALWEVQHDPNIKVAKLAEVLGKETKNGKPLAWQTADEMKQRIFAILKINHNSEKASRSDKTV